MKTKHIVIGLIVTSAIVAGGIFLYKKYTNKDPKASRNIKFVRV